MCEIIFCKFARFSVNTPKMGSNGIEMPNFDSKPLNGLRGLASLHVLLFHSVVHTTKQEIYVYGNVSFIYYDFFIT